MLPDSAEIPFGRLAPAFRRGWNAGLGLVFLLACSSEPGNEAGLGPPRLGSLQLSIEGLPAGANAAITISSPGYQKSVTRPDTIGALTIGSYTITAQEVVVGGDRYVPALATQQISVAAGPPTSVQVIYRLTSARLRLSITGAPAGTSPALVLNGPGGFQTTVTGTTELTGLALGGYTLQVPSLQSEGDRFEALPENRELILAVPDTVPVDVAVSYALATGRLIVEVSGVPAGGSAAVQVTGPGLTQVLSQTDTLVGLAPGTYLVSAGALSSGGFSYAATPGLVSVAVSANPLPAVASVSYAVITGALQIAAVGLPAGVPASLNVAGPAGYYQNLSSSLLLTNLSPGSYTVSADEVQAGGQLYRPTPGLQTHLVAPGLTPVQASVSYEVVAATLVLSVTGLPVGVPASIAVSGPGGFNQSVTGSQNLSGLAGGQYAIVASSVSAGGSVYTPQVPAQSVTVSGGAVVTVTVAYASTSGGLAVVIQGLPQGAAANVSVTGPGGFATSVAGSQTLSGLVPGSYVVNAAAVSSGGTTYTPAPSSQVVSVTGGTTAGATISYTGGGGGGGLDLSINGAYLVQATQRYDGSAPLVAGRDAYLRVFALASQGNGVQPQVRVRLYNGTTLLTTYQLAAPAASVPTTVDESSLSKSWNVLVPAALVQPGLRLLAEVDPGGTVAEADESNNQFPLSGVPVAVDVRTLPVFAARLVPVLQQSTGLQGNVTAGNQDQFLADLRKVLPVGASDIELHAAYTTTAPPLQSNDGNGAWGTVLSEILALRSSEASSRYYYGVVKVSYGSGVAGLGYVGGNSHAAIGWDFLPSAAHVLAHEVGHNMGRWHAPCGGPSGVDAGYPYAGGQIGVWGLDLAALALKPPTQADVMSYCGPNWVSDYNWSAMVAFRQGGPNNAPEAEVSAGEGLLIWGRIGASGVMLEPAFRIPAGQGALPRPGNNRLELLGADGAVLRSVRFATDEAADLPSGTEQHFAFVVPVDASLTTLVSAFRVTAGSRSTTRTATVAQSGDPELSVTRLDAARLLVRWNAARYPMALVRDGASGQILSFARGGTARLFSRADSIRVQFSDGVKNVTRPVRVLR